MGCLCSSSIPGEDDQLALDQEQRTDTYDPGNMSVSRDSVMADYQFANHKKHIVTLSPIPDSEGGGDTNGHGSSLCAAANAKRNMKELQSFDVENDILPLPRKRVIFISIAQLNACIHTIPSYILSESIFCFKAQRSWFFPATRSEQQAAKFSMRYTINFNDKFLQALSEKHDKGLVLWLEDGKTWNEISTELTQVEDIYCSHGQPIDSASTSYQALKLDESWWLNQFKQSTESIDGGGGSGSSIEAQFCDSAESVVEELQTHKLKFNPTMELLYQSNATLIPMRGFDIEAYVHAHYAATVDDDNEDINPTLSGDLNLDVDYDAPAVTPEPVAIDAAGPVEDMMRVPSVSEVASAQI